MKRVLAVILTISALIVFVGCGTQKNNSSASTQSAEVFTEPEKDESTERKTINGVKFTKPKGLTENFESSTGILRYLKDDKNFIMLQSTEASDTFSGDMEEWAFNTFFKGMEKGNIKFTSEPSTIAVTTNFGVSGYVGSVVVEVKDDLYTMSCFAFQRDNRIHSVSMMCEIAEIDTVLKPYRDIYMSIE